VILIAHGVDIGAPSMDFIRASQLEGFIEESRALLAAHGEKIVLPLDVAVVAGGERREMPLAELPAEAAILDLGRGTVAEYRRRIANAGTVFANGPAGVFEQLETEYGTKALWEAMAKSAAFSAVGGGDSVAAMNRFGLAEQFDYACTAGGAMVQFLSGKPMPVIEALKGAAARFG